jgi:hypothetical protein
MSPDLADRLSAERHRKFVGRVAERDLFRSALAADEPPFNVLYVFGTGGVGKTTLLREFANICKESGVPASYVDARNLEPSPDSFMGALWSVLDLAGQDTPFEALASRSELRVVMVDTYETLAPLNTWMSEVFLPRLPGNLLLVLASRKPPEPGWRVDPGWQRIVRPLHLQNLSRGESETYLLRREVPPDQHKGILDFTHGHPLALSLVADVFVQRPGVRFRPAETPDVIKNILEQFVQQVPGPAHRTALESCALVRYTTETLLSHMVTLPDVHELFEWLRGLTFIESGALGLFPHDVAREALVADLRWRNPDWYAELHHRARNYYAARLKQTRGQDQQRVLFDYIYLHRDNTMIRPFLEWQEAGTTAPEAMREEDKPALEAMVEEHEGPESARLAAHWLERQAEGVVIFRDLEQRPAGFVMKLALHETTAEDRGVDPAVQAAWRYLERHAPLRPGEKATLFRFWMARETYQVVSAMQSLIFGNVAQHYLTTPGLAFSFFPTADPDFWASMFAYINLPRLQEADFEVGGRRYGVYAFDWRVTPPMAWLDLLAEREVAAEPLAVSPTETTPLVVLGESDFAEAVRDALRNFHRSEELRANPLLRSRMVVERAGTDADDSAGIGALRDLLEEAADSLRASPREAKLYRALHRTCLDPAPSQERAAELLGLPFSTYRRHLKGGISRVVEILWQREIGGR